MSKRLNMWIQLRRRKARAGFVLMLVAFAGVALLGMAGLAIDVGFNEVMKSKLQAAADAAALAGALEVGAGRTGSVAAAAQMDSGLNGFTNGVGGVTVTVNQPPTSGDYAGDNSAVEAMVSAPGTAYFMRALGFTGMTLRARSAAKPSEDPYCIYAMKTSGSDTLRVTGNAVLNTSCGIHVNSSNSSALHVDNNACVTASAIKVVGNNYDNGTNCSVTPTPTYNAAVVTDPLAGLPTPSYGACNTTRYRLSSGTDYLSAGVYCNGIQVSNGAKLTLGPGDYTIVGGGLSVTGAGSQISGDGVFIYVTSGMGYSYAPITIKSGGNAQLTAETSGAYAGILFFEDRSAPYGNTHEIAGDSTTLLEGALYLIRGTLRMSNNSALADYSILVTDQMEFRGNCQSGNNYSKLSCGSPLKGGAAKVIE